VKRLVETLRRALSRVAAVPAPAPPPDSAAPVGSDLAAAFERELVRASGRLVHVADLEAARAWVRASFSDADTVWASDTPKEARLRAAEVGVDRADLLIAETGTVVRTFPSAAAARVSLVPPVSVFLACQDALVRDLPAALGRLGDAHREGKAFSTLITGPSRTADIEKQLVIPAHGPRELVVVLAETA